MHDRLAAFILLFSSIFFSSIFLNAADIRGKVVSVERGEPLARVQVAVLVEAQREAVATAITTKDGNFIIKGLAPGHYTLRLNAVGYRLITVEFSLAADEAAQEFDITLAFTRWKLALYGELLNLTNHNNPRYFYTSQNPDGTFKVVTGQGLPIVPTAGVAFEF